MTILQVDPLEGTNYHPIQSQSHREECWLEGWVSVPAALEEKAQLHFAHCDLQLENGVLVDILPLEAPPPLAAEPTAEEDRDALLVDLDYRMTLMELEVI